MYDAVDPQTNEILHMSLFPTATKQTTRWFLAELHQRYHLDNVLFLVDDADYLSLVLAEDGYRFQILTHGNRNAIERVFWEAERRILSFANSFSHVELEASEKLARSFRRLPQLNPNLTRCRWVILDLQETETEIQQLSRSAQIVRSGIAEEVNHRPAVNLHVVAQLHC